jgi:hypothetical protein
MKGRNASVRAALQSTTDFLEKKDISRELETALWVSK